MGAVKCPLPTNKPTWQRLGLLSLLAALFLAGVAQADTATNDSATLPTTTYAASSVTDGRDSYIFGGAQSWGGQDLNTIVRFDPSADGASVVGWLPSGLYRSSAAWDGNFAYIFGGVTPTGATASILRFDPSTNAVTTVGSLPTPSWGTSAVWDGHEVLIFGGYDALLGSHTSQVIRFDPATGLVTVVGSLPTAGEATSAVWTGTNALVFGGWQDNGGCDCYTSNIVQYDPATNQATIVANLPTARGYTSAIWSGTSAYVFGGSDHDCWCARSDVVKYTPSTNNVTVTNASLPQGVGDTTSTFELGKAYVFGGWTGSAALDTITDYTIPTPCTALDLVCTLSSTIPPLTTGQVPVGPPLLVPSTCAMAPSIREANGPSLGEASVRWRCSLDPW
jgi:N-acetylneuraminic acid mutarotase